MKSVKQRRKEIKEARLRKAKAMQGMDTKAPISPLPKGTVAADVKLLAQHNNAMVLPAFYIDQPFTCRDCGSEEIWTAKQQKWWYEVMLGNVNSFAVRCRSCRRKRRAEKAEQKAHMEEMAKRTPHPNEAFFRSEP